MAVRRILLISHVTVSFAEFPDQTYGQDDVGRSLAQKSARL